MKIRWKNLIEFIVMIIASALTIVLMSTFVYNMSVYTFALWCISMMLSVFLINDWSCIQ